jgi:3-oxoacyl-[acyl-carrier protein] reductase
MKLKGKKALVTGAASGIGRAIATRFIEQGAHVACVDIDASALAATVQELQTENRKVVGFHADVAVRADVEKAVQGAQDVLEGLDILVNNAGINAGGTIDLVDEEMWNRTLAVNLTSTFFLSKAVWRIFAAQGQGVIVNMSSIMGLTGARNSFVYCASKAAIIALTKSLAADGGPLGIRVNCVCPGYVRTPIMDKAHSMNAQSKIANQLPIRRMAVPAEIADGFVYLASDDASYANGSILVLDGAATVGFAGCYLEL